MKHIMEEYGGLILSGIALLLFLGLVMVFVHGGLFNHLVSNYASGICGS